jgi:hypothetical protein
LSHKDRRRVDARVAEERAHFLHVVSLFEYLDGDAVAQIVRLKLRIADQLSVRLAA